MPRDVCTGWPCPSGERELSWLAVLLILTVTCLTVLACLAVGQRWQTTAACEGWAS